MRQCSVKTVCLWAATHTTGERQCKRRWKTDVVLIWKGFVFSHDAAAGMLALGDVRLLSVTSHLKAYERENASRTSELCHSAISSLSLTPHLLSARFYSPLTCSRCLSQSPIKSILYAGSSQSRTDGKTIRWWEKNKSNYSFWVWGCSSISSPASTVSISRGKKRLMNERSAVQVSREPPLL